MKSVERSSPEIIQRYSFEGKCEKMQNPSTPRRGDAEVRREHHFIVHILLDIKFIIMSINNELHRSAQELNDVSSAVTEVVLLTTLKAKQATDWLQQNQDAIAVYNRSVDEAGVFGDDMRGF